MLEEILAATRRRLPELESRADDIIREATEARPVPSLAGALSGPGLEVIAEVKRRSPSRGELAPDLDPVARATSYARGGAAAISVLTEPEYFSGSPTDLTSVVEATGLPVLRKDFIVSPVQVWEARAWRAAAVLLIVTALDDDDLRALIATASEAGMEALVEVHTIDEAKRAVASGATLVGVNNRDLGDFNVDLGTAEAIAPHLADVPVTVAESGIFGADDASRMAAAGYDAVLVGEALVRSDDPAALVGELRLRAVER